MNALCVIGAVGALSLGIGCGGSKALRTVPTSSTLTTNMQELPDCMSDQIAVSIGIRDGVAAVVLKHSRGEPCSLVFQEARFWITDREGTRVALWRPDFMGAFRRGEERKFLLPGVATCEGRKPFTGHVTLGPQSAERDDLTLRQITC